MTSRLLTLLKEAAPARIAKAVPGKIPPHVSGVLNPGCRGGAWGRGLGGGGLSNAERSAKLGLRARIFSQVLCAPAPLLRLW